jgi:hypothetical protein
MAEYTQQNLFELSVTVLNSCGSGDPNDYGILERLVQSAAYGPPERTEGLAGAVRNRICEVDAYRIRNGVLRERSINPAAETLGPVILSALGFHPERPRTPRRIK